jgi:hypothetical protein
MTVLQIAALAAVAVGGGAVVLARDPLRQVLVLSTAAFLVWPLAHLPPMISKRSPEIEVCRYCSSPEETFLLDLLEPAADAGIAITAATARQAKTRGRNLFMVTSFSDPSARIPGQHDGYRSTCRLYPRPLR